jgi:hypothetical protein
MQGRGGTGLKRLVIVWSGGRETVRFRDLRRAALGLPPFCGLDHNVTIILTGAVVPSVFLHGHEVMVRGWNGQGY